MTELPRVLAIVGPTGSGKTDLATRLAKRFGGEIVGIDASQIYQGFDIGTGKATESDLRGVVHHNIDILSPSESSDAASFARSTIKLIETIVSEGRVRFCGGTGSYFALCDGLCRAPKCQKQFKLRSCRDGRTGGFGDACCCPR